MRSLAFAVLIAVIVVGCGKSKEYEGPTVDAFNGRLTADGKPVAFGAEDKVFLKMFLNSQKPESFNVPIKEDGTFKIGWMPIGKYSLTLIQNKKVGKSTREIQTSLPNPFNIAEGQTQYDIELGKNFKP